MHSGVKRLAWRECLAGEGIERKRVLEGNISCYVREIYKQLMPAPLEVVVHLMMILCEDDGVYTSHNTDCDSLTNEESEYSRRVTPKINKKKGTQ